MEITAYQLAERWIGLKELPGKRNNPFILGMLQLDNSWPEADEIAWCSGFANFICWQLRLPRSKSLRARSWLTVGQPVFPEHAEIGFDVVILKRGGGDQPGPEVLDAQGHVGFFSGHLNGTLYVLGGNQSNSVTVAPFPADRLLGIRRLA